MNLVCNLPSFATWGLPRETQTQLDVMRRISGMDSLARLLAGWIDIFLLGWMMRTDSQEKITGP